MSTETDKFESATYYTCDDDAESLSCEDAEGAIEEFLDKVYEHGVGIVESIRRHSPITVYAYARREVTLHWMHGTADELSERFDEVFSEEFGDPDGGSRISKNDLAELARDFESAIGRLVANTEVWQCEQVATRTYSAEEVESILRESRAEWFEETP